MQPGVTAQAVRSLILHGGQQLLSAWCPRYNRWWPRGAFYQLCTMGLFPHCWLFTRLATCVWAHKSSPGFICTLQAPVIRERWCCHHLLTLLENRAQIQRKHIYEEESKHPEKTFATSSAGYSTSPLSTCIFSICSVVALKYATYIC